MTEKIVIVGGGQAGSNCARALRGAGFGGSVTIVGEESFPPYERPLLSKDLLSGKALIEQCLVAPENWYAENEISLLLGARAASINENTRELGLFDGRTLPFDALVLATGARPRRLPETEGLASISYMRTLEDMFHLRARLSPGHRLAVVGAGFVGLEIAATARGLGAEVTVIELAERPMVRVAPSALGDVYTALHRRHGVVMQMGSTITSVEQTGDATRLGLSRGDAVLADTVVVGIGIVPEVELALAAGIEIDNGIVVDEYGCTSHEGIWAIGDCAAFWHPTMGRRLRLETWQHAQNHAIAVARNILGERRAYDEVPWGWTDQYGVNLQIAGAPLIWDEVVWRGSATDGPALMVQLHQGRVVGGATMSLPREMRFLRKMVAAGTAVAPLEIADSAIPLKELAAR